MTAREGFHAIMAIGLVIVLTVGIARGVTTAIVWSSIGLAGSLVALIQEQHERRRRRREGAS